MNDDAAVEVGPPDEADEADRAGATVAEATQPAQRQRLLTIFWVLALLGVLLAFAALFDVNSIGNLIAFVLALAAHGGAVVFILGLVYEVATSRRPSRLATWFLCAAVLTFVVYKADEFVLRQLPMDAVWKWVYAALAGAVAVGLLVVLVRWFTHEGNRERLGRQVVAGISGLALGIAAPVVFLGVLASGRQNDMDDDVPVIPVVTGLGGTYVALGDSYSAGEGLEPFQPGSPPGCHRSPYAYPLLLKFDAPVVVEFEACSGAVTADVDIGIIGGYPPQIDAAPRADVSLVTLTIGGNDVIFSDVVQSCFVYDDCIHQTFTPRDPSPARPSIVFPEAQPFDRWAEAAMVVLAANLDRVYADIRATYPSARVVVLGYPYLFPEGPAPWTQRDCKFVLRRVDGSERRALRQLTDDLNALLHERASAAGLEFVSPAAVWDGHEPCGDEGQYTNAVLPVLRFSKPVDSGTFHPNRRGQEQLAQLVACYLLANPEGPPPDPGTVPGSVDHPVECPAATG